MTIRLTGHLSVMDGLTSGTAGTAGMRRSVVRGRPPSGTGARDDRGMAWFLDKGSR